LNFSTFPINFITYLGIFSVTISLIYFLHTVIQKLFYDNVPRGFTAILFIIILFSGVQLISLGVIGQYVIRTFFQVKQRPLFIVKNKIINKKYVDG
jgi:dolichol-phosphate mannosyltransferase